MKTSLAVITVCGAVLACGGTAQADLSNAFQFDLGAADQTAGKDYVVFTIGGSFVTTDALNSTHVIAGGNSDLVGDVGVAGNYDATGNYLGSPAVHSDLALSENAKVGGNAYLDQFGQFQSTGTSDVTGSVIISNGADQTHADLRQGVIDARNFSSQARARKDNFKEPHSSSLSGKNLEETFDFTSSQRRDNVVALKNVKLRGDSTLTLEGTAKQGVIVNIAGKFSLADNSEIKLAGGLNWDSVAFNVKGSKTVSFKDDSEFRGFLVAMQNSVIVSDKAEVSGEIISGGQVVRMSGKGKVKKPKKNSPKNS